MEGSTQKGEMKKETNGTNNTPAANEHKVPGQQGSTDKAKIGKGKEVAKNTMRKEKESSIHVKEIGVHISVFCPKD